ncbi:MAG: DUF2953 domain-containing protein [Lachnospiraceae bacterium]|nr:DUF2953 domain-containing protein [Lachnospiraceae bacterium]
MAAVLLTILKILGITLLVLFGIILTVVLLLLFVPIRYKIRAHRKTEDERPIAADIKVTYLAHIVNAAFSYPEAAYLRVRVFCFTIYRSDTKKVSKDSSDEEKMSTHSGKEADDNKENAEKDRQEKKGDRAESSIKEVNSELVQDQTEVKQTGPDKESAEAEDYSQEDGNFLNKIIGFFRKIWSVLKNIRYTISRICDKIKDIVNNIRYYVEILKSDRFDRGWKVCKSQLGLLFKMLRPRKFTGELLVGTGDPASTGQVMAAYGILYPLLGNHIEVTPDFERQIVEGSLFMKGRITIFGLIKCAWIIYFNKDIRELIKLFKREAV